MASSTRTAPRSRDLRSRGIVGHEVGDRLPTGLHIEDVSRDDAARGVRGGPGHGLAGGQAPDRVEAAPRPPDRDRRRGGRPAERADPVPHRPRRPGPRPDARRPGRAATSCSPSGSAPRRSCCSTPATRTSARWPTSPRCSRTSTPTWAKRSCSRPARRPRSTASCIGLAPASKLLFSTDASLVPELYWIGARVGRQALGRVLDEHIADGVLDERDGARLGRADAVAQFGGRLRALTCLRAGGPAAVARRAGDAGTADRAAPRAAPAGPRAGR